MSTATASATVPAERAVTFTAREQAELIPCEPDAGPLGDQQVEGRTLVSLISSGTELSWGYAPPTKVDRPYPQLSGYAAIFEVAKVGSAVTGLKPGDVAFCSGNHRSWQRHDAVNVVRVPDGLAPERAVFCRLMGIGMAALTTTTARAPALVAVSGLGLVGHLAAKVFHACGYQVIACDPVASRRAPLQQAGMRTEASAPLTDASVVGKVDLVLDCSGHERSVLDACNLVRQRGEVVLAGTPWSKKTDISAFEIMHAVFHKFVVLRSGWEWEVPTHETAFRTNSHLGNYAAAMRWIADGRVNVDGLANLVPPEKAQQAYQDLMHQRTATLSTIFDWRV
ncbi:MAG: zinc-binding alcohol dehydrogenase [Planctomycetes bacterium]|nr:zinc-binding alcohol dehydrogenase [Planctomycetota bacterium]